MTKDECSECGNRIASMQVHNQHMCDRQQEFNKTHHGYRYYSHADRPKGYGQGDSVFEDLLAQGNKAAAAKTHSIAETDLETLSNMATKGRGVDFTRRTRSNGERRTNDGTYPDVQEAQERNAERVAAAHMAVDWTRAQKVLNEVLGERIRQVELKTEGKFPWTCDDVRVPDIKKLAVLAEEFGEVAREVNENMTAMDTRAPFVDVYTATSLVEHQVYLDGIAERKVKMRAELIQVAAVCVAWAETL